MLREGQFDQAWREQAERDFESVKRLISSDPEKIHLLDQKTTDKIVRQGLDKDDPTPDAVALFINAKGVTSKGMMVIFLFIAGKSLYAGELHPFRSGSKTPFLVIRQGMEKEGVDMIKAESFDFRSWFSQHGPWYLDKHRDTFIHETIHAIDFSRMRKIDTKRSPGQLYKDKSYDEYFNHPLETNAHIQSSISRFVHYLRSLKTPQAIRLIMGKNPDDMYKRFVHMTRRHEGQFMMSFERRPENVKKLKKRIAQLWQDLHRPFQGDGP